MQLFNTGSAAAATTSTAKSSGLGSSAEQQQTAAWTQKSKVQVPVREGPVCFPAPLDTANKFLESFTQRYPAPATVFCSRELESGLIDFVERRMAQGIFPDDDSLRSKAREIVGTETTAADDVVLLEKFKEMMRARLLAPTATALSGTVEDASMKDAEQPSAQKALALPLNMDLNPSDNDLDDILKDMQFQFDDDLAAF